MKELDNIRERLTTKSEDYKSYYETYFQTNILRTSIEIENQLLRTGAKPGIDYTILDLFKMDMS